ncbi:MAG TPA: hypothetical protein VJU86_21470 [Pyrinomonadaceae bacterium]|nr:hypothetical protein [Pyrinomonadaceae bacterium]
MFIRFVCGGIDQDSHVAAGLFSAALDLLWAGELPDYELEALTEIRDWFNLYLKSPFDYLPMEQRYYRAICWFKTTAHEHLRQAWAMTAVLERNDILIWTIRSPAIGYVYYEDEVQVFAEPYNDLRPRLRR